MPRTLNELCYISGLWQILRINLLHRDWLNLAIMKAAKGCLISTQKLLL